MLVEKQFDGKTVSWASPGAVLEMKFVPVKFRVRFDDAGAVAVEGVAAVRVGVCEVTVKVSELVVLPESVTLTCTGLPEETRAAGT